MNVRIYKYDTETDSVSFFTETSTFEEAVSAMRGMYDECASDGVFPFVVSFETNGNGIAVPKRQIVLVEEDMCNRIGMTENIFDCDTEYLRIGEFKKI